MTFLREQTSPSTTFVRSVHAIRRRAVLITLGLVIALVLSILLAIGIGPVSIAPGTIVQIVGLDP